ncbi:hypothetical protein [Leucobacter aridicollis]|nr:hypothetical protein [Leucobacter aridicollis]UTX53384.1 hypothetical protein KI794_01055 [Leucobacter aridicollis]
MKDPEDRKDREPFVHRGLTPDERLRAAAEILREANEELLRKEQEQVTA